MKGKPWTVEEERRLRELVKQGATVAKICAELQKSEGAVRNKMRRLRLVEVDKLNSNLSTSTKLDAEGELQSVEEALKLLNAALNALKTEGLDKTEIMRLRTIIQGARIYMSLLADYVDYKGIEEKLVDLEAKYVRWLKEKKAEGNAANRDSSFVV